MRLGYKVDQRDDYPLLTVEHLFQHHLVSNPKMDQDQPCLASRDKYCYTGSHVVATCVLLDGYNKKNFIETRENFPVYKQQLTADLNAAVNSCIQVSCQEL